MSGWDKPSRPTWDPQDGPEDGTQAFPVPDGAGADDRWSQPVGPGWSGTGAVDGQDFGRPDFGASDFGGVNTSGADLGGPDFGRGDLGRADRREPAFPLEPNGFQPDRNGFPSDRNGFSSDRNGFPLGQNGFPGDQNDFSSDRNGFPGDQNGFPGDQNGFPRGGSSSAPESDFFPQEFEQRQPGATLAGRQLPGRGNYVSGPQASARDEPPWPGPARQESARQESARPDYGRAGDYGRPGDGRPGDGRAGDYGRPGDYGRTSEYGRQDQARADFDRPGAPVAPGQDFPRRDPGRADFSAYSTYSGQPDQAEQAPPAVNRGDAERAARMDPALQDFFAPTKPDPRYTSGRPSQAPQPPGLPGPGQPGPGGPGPGPGWSEQGEQPSRRTDGRGPQPRPHRAAGPWEDPADRPSGSRDGRPGAGRHDEDEDEPTAKGKLFVAIGGVVVVIAAAGIAYLAVHGSGGSNDNATGGSTPTTSASAPTSTARPNSTGAAKSPGVTGSATAAGAYVLSTPSTAADFPIGTDPQFLATATSTVAAFEQSAIKGGGGTVTGSPVSASYTLPDEQTIEFVGYQGTFNPTTVMANLKDYGSSEATYPAGPNGGDLACANTTATSSTPSGAVCVWVTKSTLGFTEFFTQANGPESLNSAQAKGAEDTVDLRASVEKLKS
jgi:hypothetical protein